MSSYSYHLGGSVAEGAHFDIHFTPIGTEVCPFDCSQFMNELGSCFDQLIIVIPIEYQPIQKERERERR